MLQEPSVMPDAVKAYLHSRPRWIRWREWLVGRRYAFAPFPDRPKPLVVVAYSRRDSVKALEIVRAVEQGWAEAPQPCRDEYDEILKDAPKLVIIQFRRTNICGCLGHRHVVVKEPPFAEPHDALGGDPAGELDIAYQRVESWLALPLMDITLDAQFVAGSRQREFQAERLRLQFLSILLHEINHMVRSQEPEASVRERSLAFYRDALAQYVEDAKASLSLTIDRSFSRFERD
jgi:ectoine hydroxylase-related dioxygenase (phytanoyl-CoA dioxygenase family)